MIDTPVIDSCPDDLPIATVRAVPKEPMKSRNIRVGDDLWKAALEAAERDNENLADVMRAFLAWYTRERGAQLPERPAAKRDA